MTGITREEFDLLRREESAAFLREHLNDDPLKLAFQGVAPVLCTQLKYLRRIREKLPRYYDALAVIPPVSYEQASSFQTTAARDFSGRRALDLTCGLGADTLRLAECFDRVVTLEREELLCEIARYNFARMGAKNIDVIHTDCESYLAAYNGEPFDLVFADPARRDEKGRHFLLPDCSPDILELLPILRRISRRLMVKLSPLFDVDEAVRLFGGTVRIEVLSVAGECKELLVDLDFAATEPGGIINRIIERSGTCCSFPFPSDKVPAIPDTLPPEDAAYALIPDVALVKSRTVEAFFERYAAGQRFCRTAGNLILSDRDIDGFPGKSYPVGAILPYRPKTLKTWLKKEGIKSVTLITEGSFAESGTIRKALSLREGSDATLIATRIGESPVLILTGAPQSK